MRRVEAEDITPSYSKYVLFVLLLTYVLNQWDRYLFNYLSSVDASEQCPSFAKPPYREVDCDGNKTCIAAHECYGKYNPQYGANLTKENYAVLASFGFTALFAVMLLFAGRLADVANRTVVIAAALLGWSGATAWQGAAESFPMMLGARLTLGMFAAFSTPATYSLIASYFPPETRATANGIYAFGVYVGGGLSSLSIVMSHQIGWRWSSYSVGVCGAAVTLLLMLTVKEPVRSNDATKVSDADDDEEYGHYEPIAKSSRKKSKGAVARFFTSCLSDTGSAIVASFSDPAVSWLFVAAAMRFVGGFAIGVYMPKYFKATWPSKNDQYSVLNAGVVSAGGALSAFIGGKLSDTLRKRDVRWSAWLPGLGAALGFLPFIGVMYSTNFYAAIAFYFFEYLFAECWFGPAISIVQNRIPVNVRGTTISIFLFVSNMVGNVCPIIISNFVQETAESYRQCIFYAVLVSYASCAILFCIVATKLRTPPPHERDEDGLSPLLN